MEPQITQNTQMDADVGRSSSGNIDLLVEHMVLVELKVTKAIDEIHRAQCLNYLKATGLHLCLLLNFGKPRLEIKLIVLAL